MMFDCVQTPALHFGTKAGPHNAAVAHLWKMPHLVEKENPIACWALRYTLAMERKRMKKLVKNVAFSYKKLQIFEANHYYIRPIYGIYVLASLSFQYDLQNPERNAERVLFVTYGYESGFSPSAEIFNFHYTMSRIPKKYQIHGSRADFIRRLHPKYKEEFFKYEEQENRYLLSIRLKRQKTGDEEERMIVDK